MYVGKSTKTVKQKISVAISKAKVISDKEKGGGIGRTIGSE